LQLRESVGLAPAVLAFPFERHAAGGNVPVATFHAGIEAGFEAAMKLGGQAVETEIRDRLGVIGEAICRTALRLAHSLPPLPWRGIFQPTSLLPCLRLGIRKGNG